MFKKDHHNDDQDIEMTPETEVSDTAHDAGVDIIPEDEETTPDALKKLREKVKKLTAEKQEYLDGWQRAKADFVNARKRDEESRKEFLKFAKEDLIAELIPVLESFDMARSNKAQWESVDKNWRTGIEYINTQLKKVLENNGLTEVNPLGEPFDPMRDEAIAYKPVDTEKDHHKVIEVVQKGYKLSDKIIRAPRVNVGEFKKDSEKSEPAQNA